MARPELAAEPRQEYVDDGYSGTSTSRPAFQRLIEDAQDGKVKTIIVKDFSRFARDYIEAGDYMERIFPLLGVRFISVNDGYDSGIQIRNDVCGLEVAIKNIINASYSRDLSAKIAAADHVMQKKGMYLGGYRPFGFLPDPNDCHKLILDPVASQYVRLIFELALQGNRTGTIAKILNEKQIPTPAAYHVAENHVYSEQKAWDLGIRVLLYWMSPNGKQALLQYRFRNVKNLKIYLCQIYRDSLKTYNNRAMRLLREECRHEFWASYEPASDNSGGKPENECWERCYPYSWESGLYLRFAEERSEVYCDYSVHR